MPLILIPQEDVTHSLVYLNRTQALPLFVTCLGSCQVALPGVLGAKMDAVGVFGTRSDVFDLRSNRWV